MEGAPKVALVNEAVVRHYFPNTNPVGQRFQLGSPENVQIETGGLVKDTRHLEVRGNPPRTVYLPYPQSPSGQATFLVRSTDDPRLPVYGAGTQAEQLNRLLREERFFPCLPVSSALSR